MGICQGPRGDGIAEKKWFNIEMARLRHAHAAAQGAPAPCGRTPQLRTHAAATGFVRGLLAHRDPQLVVEARIISKDTPVIERMIQ